MGKFISIPVEVDPEARTAAAKDEIAAGIPGWVAPDGSFEDRLLRAESRLAADLTEMAADVPGEIMFEIGRSFLKIAPQGAVPAQVTSTWTMVDAAGYTIDANTEVGIPIAGDDLVAFRVVEDVSVAPGQTKTADGGVLLEAVIPGEAGNDLNGTPKLLSTLTFVVQPGGIALEDGDGDPVETDGGVDAETTDEYLDDLTDETGLLTTTPILPENFAVVARRVPTVYRALAVDGYNPDDDTFDNERMVAVASIEEDGTAVSAGTKTAVTTLLESLRESNFLSPAFDPTYNAIDVDYTGAKALPGFDPAVVKTAVDSAIANYLSPANFGRFPTDTDPKIWRRITVVRHSELVALVNSVAGLDYIDSEDLTLALSGGSLAAANVTLDGVAPLTEAGDITGTVT